MLSAAVGRIRAVIGARLRLRQAQYDAAADALRLRPAIERVELTWEQWRAEEHQQKLAQGQQMAELGAAMARVQAAIIELRDLQIKHLRLSRAGYDDIGALRQRLIALRKSDAYAATFENRNPLVSVPIATYNAAEPLVERAIASVQAQTYGHWEIVVVGDGCTDDTAARLDELADPRIRFVNLPFRAVYPEDPNDRWFVSGAAAWNHAVELSRGVWLCPLDDDDEFLPNHLETLLDLALERRAEYAYGGIEQVGPPDVEPYLFSFPPKFAQVGMQAAIYLRALDFFECDIYSWAMDEPGDWNVIRRMRDAGVRMAATEAPVTRYYPSMQKHV